MGIHSGLFFNGRQGIKILEIFRENSVYLSSYNYVKVELARNSQIEYLVGATVPIWRFGESHGAIVEVMHTRAEH